MKVRHSWIISPLTIVLVLTTQISWAETVNEQFSDAQNLAKQGKNSESILAYEVLIREYPNQPEPYNNLAVLYAEQGNYEAASKTLLRALNNHNVWGKLFNNLKAVHTKIASSAYSRALGTKENNHTIQLAVIESIEESEPSIVARAEQPQLAKTEVAMSTRKPAAAKAVVEEVDSPDELFDVPSDIVIEEIAAAPSNAKSVSEADRSAVISALEGWAKAWSEQNTKRYLASYSPRFKPSGGVTLQDWKKLRKERLAKPKSIQIKLKSIGMRIDNNMARVSLRQNYRSDSYHDSVMKRFILHRSKKGWKIVREEVTGP